MKPPDIDYYVVIALCLLFVVGLAIWHAYGDRQIEAAGPAPKYESLNHCGDQQSNGD